MLMHHLNIETCPSKHLHKHIHTYIYHIYLLRNKNKKGKEIEIYPGSCLRSSTYQ